MRNSRGPPRAGNLSSVLSLVFLWNYAIIFKALKVAHISFA